MPFVPHKPGTEINCLVIQDDAASVRGFLTLPGTDISGELKLASDLPGSFDLEDVAPMRLVLQDGHAGTLGCISDGFVVHHGISLPTPAAYPLRIHVNEAILGIDDPDLPVNKGYLDCRALMEFFREPEIDLVDAAGQNTITKPRLSLPFGRFRMEIEEISTRNLSDSGISVDFTGRLSLEGEPRSLHDWIGPLTKAIGFFSFWLDRPLTFDSIGSMDGDGSNALYATWRKPAAPIDTVPLFRDGSIGGPTLRVASSAWADLWTQAPQLMEHVLAFQLRRDSLTLDDRLLVLARTLERYHGYVSRFKSTIRSRSRNRELRDAIVGSLPDSARTEAVWLGDAINEANRKRLSMQLEEILSDLGPEIMDASGISMGPRSFAKSVVKTRNFFTHPKKKAPAGVSQGFALLEMVHRLWFITRACILVELGLPRDHVAAALNNSAQRHYLVHGRHWATG
jgi:hypothetical protein